MKLKDIANLSNGDDGSGSTRRVKVVVVDDDESVLKSMKVVLGKKYDLECFSDPVAGATAAARPDVKVAILDVRMPLHDGFWVFGKIRETNRKVQIVFNSAYQDVRDSVHINEICQPFAFVRKGDSSKQFIKLIEDACAAYPAQR